MGKEFKDMTDILLVDDEAHALKELEAAVGAETAEANIHSFLNAREALDFAATTLIDIAFLDINMPFMDGISLARDILKLYPECNIIFCSAHTEYALDSMNVYCSAYLLKPVTSDRIAVALKHLRYPVKVKKPRLDIRCFGNFDVFCDGKPVSFKYKKSKELLAYLTDRNGAEATTREIMAAIFEENKASYFSNIRLDVINTLEALGVSDAVYTAYGRMGIVRNKVSCDYFDYLDGKNVGFFGEYMSQYSFAEITCAALSNM